MNIIIIFTSLCDVLLHQVFTKVCQLSCLAPLEVCFLVQGQLGLQLQGQLGNSFSFSLLSHIYEASNLVPVTLWSQGKCICTAQLWHKLSQWALLAHMSNCSWINQSSITRNPPKTQTHIKDGELWKVEFKKKKKKDKKEHFINPTGKLQCYNC